MKGTETRPLSEKPWAREGLEQVRLCPLCASPHRSLLYDGLWDNVFFAAPGKWSLWRCGRCGAAYLDPRPDRTTIGLAYSSYYTHHHVDPPAAEGPLGRLRTKLGNDYRNSRYGTALAPANRWGRVVARLFPPLRWPVDVSYRFLPRHSGRVLDLGCGSGDWLLMARGAGWSVAGADPDPIARGLAAANGIEVREAIEDWEDQAGTFDAVTMSHVIEHVHDPLATLRAAYRLLRPSGTLFIDTPNIDALGHERYGRNWRGLEPPRHLIIFSRECLRRAVHDAGFVRIRFPARLYPFAGLSLASRRITAGVDPYDETERPNLPPPPPLSLRLKSVLASRRSEFLTLTCERAA